MSKVNVGIVGVGTYLPNKIMTAKEISDATKVALIKDFDKVLSLNLAQEIGSKIQEEVSDIDDELTVYIESKIEERKLAKQSKNYALADAIRAELNEKGVELIDTPQGTTYKLK